jgi:membrane-associated phospholipid phosphatase
VASLQQEQLDGVGHGDVSAPTRRTPSHTDVLAPRPGGIAERCSDWLHACSPAVAALIVAIVGWVVVAAAIIGLGLLLVHVLLHGGFGTWDEDVVRSLAGDRTGPLTDASWVGSGLAETLTVVAVGLGLTGFLLVKRAWPAAALVVLSLVLEITMYFAVTTAVHRQRPFVVQLERRRQGASFPSGHTAAAVVLYFLIAVVVTMYVTNALTRRIVWTAAVLVPVIVACSRIYRGMHHPTDAAAGALMGVGCVVVALLAVRTAVGVAQRRRA